MTLVHTKRFLLRPIEKADAPVFARLCNDELIARNTARIPHPYTLEDAEFFAGAAAQAFALKKEFAFAVCDAGDIIACCGVMRITNEMFELGYWVGAAARGLGVATEAARAVTHFAFEKLGAHTVCAGHFIDNPASGRVLEKAGLRYTGKERMQFSIGRGGEAASALMNIARADFSPPDDVRFA